MTDRTAVLFANAAFYTAFHNRDLKAMERVWAKDRPVSCIHPGWPALHGRDDVLRSWRGILGNAQAPKIRSRAERVEIYGDTAVVICVEDLADQQYLIATNVFVRAGSVWTLVHHQAGPANIDPTSFGDDDDEPEGPVN